MGTVKSSRLEGLSNSIIVEVNAIRKESTKIQGTVIVWILFGNHNPKKENPKKLSKNAEINNPKLPSNVLTVLVYFKSI